MHLKNNKVYDFTSDKHYYISKKIRLALVYFNSNCSIQTQLIGSYNSNTDEVKESNDIKSKTNKNNSNKIISSNMILKKERSISERKKSKDSGFLKEYKNFNNNNNNNILKGNISNTFSNNSGVCANSKDYNNNKNLEYILENKQLNNNLIHNNNNYISKENPITINSTNNKDKDNVSEKSKLNKKVYSNKNMFIPRRMKTRNTNNSNIYNNKSINYNDKFINNKVNENKNKLIHNKLNDLNLNDDSDIALNSNLIKYNNLSDVKTRSNYNNSKTIKNYNVNNNNNSNNNQKILNKRLICKNSAIKFAFSKEIDIENLYKNVYKKTHYKIYFNDCNLGHPLKNISYSSAISISEDFDVLIIENDQPYFACNYILLYAINKKIPVLTIKWLRDSNSAHEFLPFDNYIFYNKNIEAKYKFSFKKAYTRYAKKECNYLKDYKFYVSKNIENYEQINYIIQSAKGTVLNQLPNVADKNIFLIMKKNIADAIFINKRDKYKSNNNNNSSSSSKEESSNIIKSNNYNNIINHNIIDCDDIVNSVLKGYLDI